MSASNGNRAARSVSFAGSAKAGAIGTATGAEQTNNVQAIQNERINWQNS